MHSPYIFTFTRMTDFGGFTFLKGIAYEYLLQFSLLTITDALVWKVRFWNQMNGFYCMGILKAQANAQTAERGAWASILPTFLFLPFSFYVSQSKHTLSLGSCRTRILKRCFTGSRQRPVNLSIYLGQCDVCMPRVNVMCVCLVSTSCVYASDQCHVCPSDQRDVCTTDQCHVCT